MPESALCLKIQNESLSHLINQSLNGKSTCFLDTIYTCKCADALLESESIAVANVANVTTLQPLIQTSLCTIYRISLACIQKAC